jgi:predicted hydrocarbon binding protein/KaiC/GvpD/RAD55 family RecA-like ATPase
VSFGGNPLSESGSVSFGIPELDRLLGGGLIPGNSYLLEVEPGTGELSFLAAFLKEGLRQKQYCAVISVDYPHDYLIGRLGQIVSEIAGAVASGSIVVVDLHQSGAYDPEHRSPVLMTENPTDPSSVARLYLDMAQVGQSRIAEGEFTGSRSIICSLSSMIMNFKFEPAYKLARRAHETVRSLSTTTVSTLDPRMFPANVVAAFERLYDGTIALSMREIDHRFQRFVRVKESPLAGFYLDEVPYSIVEGKPSLLTALTELHKSFKDHLMFNADGTIDLAGSRFILTNIELTKTLLNQAMKLLGQKTAAEEIYRLYKGSAQVEFKTLMSAMKIVPGTTDPRKILDIYASYLSTTGIGTVEVDKFNSEQVVFKVSSSICILNRKENKPMAPYLAGTLAGAIEVIMSRPVTCTETRCQAMGDDFCEFDCRVKRP